MTRSTMQARTSRLARPGPAYIARFRVDDNDVEFAVGEDDLQQDASWVARLLSERGIGAGATMVVTGSTAESPWLDAFRTAVNAIGGAFSNCEARRSEAWRLDLYLRRLHPDAVVGLTAELVEGMVEIEGGVERLAATPLLLARPSALPHLQAAGCPSGVVAFLGPALALSRTEVRAELDPTQWVCEQDGNELLVTTIANRYTQFDRQRSGTRGRVVIAEDGAPLLHLDEFLSSQLP